MSVKLQAAQTTQLSEVLELLTAQALPTAGVADHFSQFIVAIQNDSIVGCAGLEIYRTAGLLRSLAVIDSQRTQGLGTQLTQTLIAQASRLNLHSVSLLTTTAADYFPRFGFKPIARAELPKLLSASAELRGACPDTAIALTLILKEV